MSKLTTHAGDNKALHREGYHRGKSGLRGCCRRCNAEVSGNRAWRYLGDVEDEWPGGEDVYYCRDCMIEIAHERGHVDFSEDGRKHRRQQAWERWNKSIR
jgi:hypothetical protein